VRVAGIQVGETQGRADDVADKWADYLISAVRYNAANTHIEKVKVHEDQGDKVGSGSEWTRKEVIDSLEAGNTFMTIFLKSGSWHKGSEVRIIIIGGEKFIRTDADEIKEDNLEDLPRF
jgi:hypothetical protein